MSGKSDGIFAGSRGPWIVTGLMAVAGLGIAGCPLAPQPGGGDMTNLRVQFTGLESLNAAYVYEGWLLVGGAPVSAGRFTVDADGAATPDTFAVARADADAATVYILTIEPAVGDDPAPSDTHLLAGDFAGNAASLSIAHAAALGSSFAGAAGSFILVTPTTSMIDEDFDQGIWYADPTVADGPGPTLTLPVLPAGWAYEGWVVVGGQPISTGRFLMADEADSDGAGPTAGPDGFPPLPGQDFIDPAVVLTGGMAVISVEPQPDDSPAPFTLKPLVDMNIESVAPPTQQAMTNNAAGSSPTGMVTIGAE